MRAKRSPGRRRSRPATRARSPSKIERKTSFDSSPASCRSRPRSPVVSEFIESEGGAWTSQCTTYYSTRRARPRAARRRAAAFSRFRSRRRRRLSDEARTPRAPRTSRRRRLPRARTSAKRGGRAASDRPSCAIRPSSRRCEAARRRISTTRRRGVYCSWAWPRRSTTPTTARDRTVRRTTRSGTSCERTTRACRTDASSPRRTSARPRAGRSSRSRFWSS
mmetsp:Transcript_34853/g.105073  ORF Transcript_34853/g.105073 Transcript_34853/m.105073 type:complete len:221 (+) Transcript_34853:672-1334(+)